MINQSTRLLAIGTQDKITPLLASFQDENPNNVIDIVTTVDQALQYIKQAQQPYHVILLDESAVPIKHITRLTLETEITASSKVIVLQKEAKPLSNVFDALILPCHPDEVARLIHHAAELLAIAITFALHNGGMTWF